VVSFFTFLELEAQWIENWERIVSEFGTFVAGFAVPEATVRSVEIGADLRIGARAGPALRCRRNEAEVAAGVFEGQDLPLVPRHHASARLAYQSTMPGSPAPA
jgi:hypothetical protein